jgi:hypothetical protein
MVGDDPAGVPDPGNQPGDDGSDGAGGDLTITADAITGCPSVTNVILYSESTYELRLPLAFQAAANTCTRYFVHLPAIVDAASGLKILPRPNVDKVHALGPNFFAMAEFAWGDWRQWIEQSPGTRNWEQAGKLFRQSMTAAGYDVSYGDTWAVNEFPSSTRTGALDVWTHEASAVKGLYEGDGSASSAGVVYLVGMSQGLTYFSEYKPNIENWLQQDSFWNAMDQYVRFFAEEVYADPHYNCVIGSNVQDDADHLNAYLEHIPRLAAAGGTRTATAHAYLQHAYVPLVNEAWNSNNGFGDNLVSLGNFEKFSRLQVYATHYWAANHGYPGRRLGFAWCPKDTTEDQDIELSGIIARSVQRAYPTGAFYGLGKLACSVGGDLSACGCSMSGSFNGDWATFGNW